MAKLKLQEVKKYVEENISSFHQAREKGLIKLKLSEILLKKNPYLFKAKNILTSQEFVKNLADAYLSSQEETMFGTFLEGLAIFVCKKVYNGQKSSAEGIDLEFEKEGIKYIVTVKSGTNWGNSAQVAKMLDSFRKAKKILGTNAVRTKIIAINGCCYGRIKKIDKGEYLKIAGQEFWEFISGNNDLYTEIVEPLGHKAKERNENFDKVYARLLNLFTVEFSKEFCIDGNINWNKIVQFNSGKEKIKVHFLKKSFPKLL